MAVDEAAGDAICGSGLACRAVGITGSAGGSSDGVGRASARRPAGIAGGGQQVRRYAAETGRGASARAPAAGGGALNAFGLGIAVGAFEGAVLTIRRAGSAVEVVLGLPDHLALRALHIGPVQGADLAASGAGRADILSRRQGSREGLTRAHGLAGIVGAVEVGLHVA